MATRSAEDEWALLRTTRLVCEHFLASAEEYEARAQWQNLYNQRSYTPVVTEETTKEALDKLFLVWTPYRLRAAVQNFGWGPVQGIPEFKREVYPSANGWRLGHGVVVSPWRGGRAIPEDPEQALLEIERGIREVSGLLNRP